MEIPQMIFVFICALGVLYLVSRILDIVDKSTGNIFKDIVNVLCGCLLILLLCPLCGCVFLSNMLCAFIEPDGDVVIDHTEFEDKSNFKGWSNDWYN